MQRRWRWRRLDTGLIWSVNRSTGYGTGGGCVVPGWFAIPGTVSPYPGPYHRTRDRITVPRNGIPVPRNHAPWSFPHPRVGTTLGYMAQRRWRWTAVGHRFDMVRQPVDRLRDRGGCVVPEWFAIPGTVSPYPGPYHRTPERYPRTPEPCPVVVPTSQGWDNPGLYDATPLALAAVGHPFDMVPQPVNRIRDRGGCVVPGWFAIPGTVSPYPGPYHRTRDRITVPRNHAPWSFPHPRVGTTLGYTMQRRWRWTGDASIDESPHSQRYRSSNSMRCFCNRDRSSS